MQIWVDADVCPKSKMDAHLFSPMGQCLAGLACKLDGADVCLHFHEACHREGRERLQLPQRLQSVWCKQALCHLQHSAAGGLSQRDSDK